MAETYFEKVSFEQFRKACLDINAAAGMKGANDDLIRVIYESIQLPRRATSGSAGYDFYVPYTCSFAPGIPTTLPTGIRVHLRPWQFLMCVPRSGLGFKYGMRLKNSTGIIDSDYVYADNEGHIMAKIDCDESFSLLPGDRFMQGIILPYHVTDDDEPLKLCRTGGFGSTGGTA